MCIRDSARSDLGFEILGDHSNYVIKRIQGLIDHPDFDCLEPDSAGAATVVLNIEILCAIHKSGLMRCHPHPDIVKGWRDKFFDVFDEFAENNWDSDFAKERRKAFRSPFNRLIRACKTTLGV